MADLASELTDLGITPDEMGRRLGMEQEEVERLIDRGNMVRRGAAEGFNQGWKPTTKKETPE